MEEGGSESLGTSAGTSSEIGWSFGQRKGRRLPMLKRDKPSSWPGSKLHSVSRSPKRRKGQQRI